MSYKVINKTNDPRKFRIHKTAEAFFIRSGEELIVHHKPIISNFNILEVINLDEEINEMEEKLKRNASESGRIKSKRRKK